jgi:hypothetical protein
MTESDAYFILNLLSGIGPVKARRLTPPLIWTMYAL